MPFKPLYGWVTMKKSHFLKIVEFCIFPLKHKDGHRFFNFFNFSKQTKFSLTMLSFRRRQPGLTRVKSLRFLLFEIKRGLVYNSTIFKLTNLFIFYFFIQNVNANKKYLRKETNKVTAVWNTDRTVQSTSTPNELKWDRAKK